jgi:diguanylate cyclase (GGDEF)-like protein
MSHICTVLMMDVDHFKRYNDAQGHQAGDDVLRGVGAVLREATREMDWSARYGGEEFFALLPETDAKEAGEVAERIRTKLRERIFVGGRVTLSIGMAQYPTHGESPEAVIAAADAALYQAKADGRDRVVRAGGTKRGSGSQRGA